MSFFQSVVKYVLKSSLFSITSPQQSIPHRAGETAYKQFYPPCQHLFLKKLNFLKHILQLIEKTRLNNTKYFSRNIPLFPIY